MGAIPNKLPGLPGHRAGPGGARAVRDRVGSADHAAVRLAPYGHVPRDGPRRAHRGVLHRREPGELGGRQPARDEAPREPRHVDRAGHRDDEDRRDRRRGLAGRERRVRVRGDRHELRAPRPARPQGPRPARAREGRHLDHRASSRSGSATTGASSRRAKPGTSSDRSRRCTRHDVGTTGAMGGAQWPCWDEEIPGRSTCTRGSGRTTPRSGCGQRRSASSSTSRRWMS